MFTSYVQLRHRKAYPKMTELTHFMGGVGKQISFPYIGKMDMVEDKGNLLTSDNVR